MSEANPEIDPGTVMVTEVSLTSLRAGISDYIEAVRDGATLIIRPRNARDLQPVYMTAHKPANANNPVKLVTMDRVKEMGETIVNLETRLHEVSDQLIAAQHGEKVARRAHAVLQTELEQVKADLARTRKALTTSQAAHQALTKKLNTPTPAATQARQVSATMAARQVVAAINTHVGHPAACLRIVRATHDTLTGRDSKTWIKGWERLPAQIDSGIWGTVIKAAICHAHTSTGNTPPDWVADVQHPRGWYQPMGTARIRKEDAVDWLWDMHIKISRQAWDAAKPASTPTAKPGKSAKPAKRQRTPVGR